MPLSTTSPHLQFAVALYEEAFPHCERRDTAQWLTLIEEQPLFHIDELTTDAGFAGFISYWTFRDFSYVEHFAVRSTLRGGGIGGTAIEALVREQQPRPVVLEIEPPTDTLTRRRHDFYARHGLHLSTAPYLQPPYHADEAPLPLALMTTDLNFLSQHFDEVVSTIHRQVYSVNDLHATH